MTGQALRSQGHLLRLDQAKQVNFERNGSLSVIPKESAPRIIEVGVEEGVKTIRLKFE
jgi:hypothetical protein